MDIEGMCWKPRHLCPRSTRVPTTSKQHLLNQHILQTLLAPPRSVKLVRPAPLYKGQIPNAVWQMGVFMLPDFRLARPPRVSNPHLST